MEFLVFVSFVGVLFGGKGLIKRFIRKHRIRKNARLKEKVKREWLRSFNQGLRDVQKWRDESEPTKVRHQNIICKNPRFAAVWR